MKIGIFTNNYLPNPYGVPGSVETFRKEFEKMGHKVFVFAPDWPGYKDENKNVFRYPSLDIKIKFRFPLAIPYSKKMDAILENLDLDIIHSQHPNLLGAAAEKWARKKNIPLVFTWHTLYDKYSHFVPFLPKKLVNYWTIRNARNYANLADKVIAPTDSIIPILRKWKVKNDIIAIPTGVEEEIFSDKNREKSRRNFGFEEKNIVILLVSRLTEEKNVGFVFKSLVKILKSDSRIKFLVVGGGYLLDNLINWTRRKKLTGQIIFVGEKKRTEIAEYYAVADIFVYASLSETQGMIVTEAMYAGLPVVAIRATGISSLVEDGKNGFLVRKNKKEFMQKVQNLILDKELRKKMGVLSSHIAREKYTASVCAKKMLEVYDDLTKIKK